MRNPRLTTVLMLAILLLSACNGGGKDNKKSAANTTPTTSAAAPTVPPSISATSTDPYCVSLRSYDERFGKVNLNITDPQVFRSVMQEAVAAAKDAEGAAPSAIKPDLALLNRALQRFVTILDQVNYDIGKVTPTAIQELSSPEFVAAGQRVDAYTRNHCT